MLLKHIHRRVALLQPHRCVRYVHSTGVKDGWEMTLRTAQKNRLSNDNPFYKQVEPDLHKHYDRLRQAVESKEVETLGEAVRRAADHLEDYDTRWHDSTEAETNLISWGSFAHHNPGAVDTLRRVLQTEPTIASMGCSIFTRTLQWTPEQVPRLLDDDILNEVTVLCNRLARFRDSEAAQTTAEDLLPIGLLLLAYLLTGAMGTDREQLAKKVLLSRPVLQWWRQVSDSNILASRPIATHGLHSLMGCFESFEELHGQLAVKDLTRLRRISEVREAENPKAEKLRKGFCYASVGRILYMKWTNKDTVFIDQAHKEGWPATLLSWGQGLGEWRTIGDLHITGSHLSCVVYGASVFVDRWPLEMDHMGWSKFVVDRLRFTIGFLYQRMHRLEEEEARERLKNGTRLVAAALMKYLEQVAVGEINEMRYGGPAYNSNRTWVLRQGRLPGIISRLLRMFPKERGLVEGSVAVIMLLLGHEEQIFSIRDAQLFESFAIAREKATDPKLQQSVGRVMKLISDAIP